MCGRNILCTKGRLYIVLGENTCKIKEN